MADHQKVKITAKELENAESMWQGFMAISKASTIAVCGILFLLWLFFIAF